MNSMILSNKTRATKRWRTLAVLFFILSFANIKAQSSTDSSFVYIHNQPPGMDVRMIKGLTKLFIRKNSSEKKVLKKDYVSKAAPIPKRLFKDFQIDITQVMGRNVTYISPKTNASGKYILYLHGGAYVNNIFRQHWVFISKLVQKTNCTMVVPDYPLAPTATYIDAFAMLDSLYEILLQKTDSKNILLMGDSAGGGLALALAQKQKNEGQPSASQVILISPWLDISLSNPEIEDVQKNDPILHAKSLYHASKAWAGMSELTNYLVSPIYGNFDGLPKISIFIGTHDILIADCQKLKSLLDQKNIPMNYFEYPELFHVWVLFTPIKESKVAIEQICKLILDF